MLPNKLQDHLCNLTEETSEQHGHSSEQNEDERQVYHPQRFLLVERCHLFLRVHTLGQHLSHGSKLLARAHLPLHYQAKLQAKLKV